ncbi:hypothetical protein pKMKP103_CDS0067 [Klebsiella phage pKMKP103]|nr:hypothetical protein pKMKP103_CDS0067 [Klebsiella phage pKMKP103]
MHITKRLSEMHITPEHKNRVEFALNSSCVVFAHTQTVVGFAHYL